MEKLNYQVLENLGYQGYLKKEAPEKAMQFGEGNFLRAFADYFFDCANEKAGWNGKIAIIQPIEQGLTEQINQQEGLYTLYLRGSEKGEKVDAKRVISVVSRCINPYVEYQEAEELACSDDLEYIVSNTQKQGLPMIPAAPWNSARPAAFPESLRSFSMQGTRQGKKGW